MICNGYDRDDTVLEISGILEGVRDHGGALVQIGYGYGSH